MPTTNVIYLPQFEPGVYQPEFDPLANKPANLVSGERHTLTPANGRNSQLLVPLFGPFFYDPDETTLYHTPLSGSPRALVEGQDFFPVFYFIGASRGTRKPIYGGFSFTNSQIEGTITIGYRTLGGNWILSQSEINRILTDYLVNPRVIAWEQIVDLPQIFPVIDHEWYLNDVVGMTTIHEDLEGIEEAIANRPAPIISPPQVDPTKVTVGLGNVDNFSTASVEDSILGLSDNLFMTPEGTLAAILYHRQVVMKISEDEDNRASLGGDDGVYVPELQIAPLSSYNEVVHPDVAPIDANGRTTEDLEIEFAQGIGGDVLQLYTNIGILPNLQTEAKDNLVNAINELVNGTLKSIPYESRATLRAAVPRQNGAISIEGLGLFFHEVGSQEPDDDETCFKTSAGAWILRAIDWDLLNATTRHLEEEAAEHRDSLRSFKGKFLQKSAKCTFTSIASASQVNFMVPFVGVSQGDQVFVTTNSTPNARVMASARVTGSNIVVVTLKNPSNGLATLAEDDSWTLTAIKKLDGPTPA